MTLGAIAAGAISFACSGCGWTTAGQPPLRCPEARPADDVDHVLVRRLAPGALAFPTGDEANPFVRYRSLFHAWHAARAAGGSDAGYVALVDRLDAAVAAVDGAGFRVTPLLDTRALAERLGLGPAGGVLVKDETGNVSGSHKARHLFGTLLELEIAGVPRERRLAIASCGNAALAAAVVARAAGRPLDVYIPADADPVVVERLRALGAGITVCEREPGLAGDPTVARMLAAVEAGAIPFTCQGNENAFAVQGALALGYELAQQVAATGRRLDRLVVQVGGGALASACIQGLEEARDLGVIDRLPRLHAVQTEGGFPLVRAWERVAAGLLAAAGDDGTRGSVAARAERLRAFVSTPDGAARLAEAARHRSAAMWPWETTPHSVAHGILDDETYDWFAVVRGMLVTGGHPVVVDEPTLVEAAAMARETTGVDADETGTAGLAGLLQLARAGAIPPDETVAVLLTGVRRRVGSAAPGSGTSNPALSPAQPPQHGDPR